MKSRFYLAFILAGILPVAGLAGFYIYTMINEGLSAPSAPVATSVSVNVQPQETEVQTIASSLFNAINSTNADATSLASHRTSADMQSFINTHSGVSGVVVVDPKGQALRTVPVGSSLIGTNYSSDPEFAKIVSKFKKNGNQNYEFYTSRLGYPAFIFAVPLVNQSFAEVILKVANFFKGKSSNGQYFILDGSSGQFLYHSDPSQLNTSFNSQHEAWLDKVQSDLTAKNDGSIASGDGNEAVYSYLHFGTFGVVHVFPLIMTTSVTTTPISKPFTGDWSELMTSPMSLGFLLVLALLCFCAYFTSGILIAPFRRVVNVILAASEDSVTLTPEVVKSFGGSEAGQIVQALALYNEKIQKEKSAAIQSVNDQLNSIQRQTRQYQSESQEKTQQLTDKLKELDALKGMSEGLRNQNEQAKAENARLKGEVEKTQNAQLELSALQVKYTQMQTQLKEAQDKALTATTAVTPIQVSQVRAAAIRTMSEELKNTLAIIKGYVSSVIGAGQGGVNEKQQEFLGMVINRSARLEKFINDLVDIYQVEIEQKDAKTEEVNLASEIETFAFNFQTQTELKNLKFKVEAKPGLPKVPVVRRRMIQLWNVLYLQLIKDSPKGSTISIVVEPIGDKVKVTVQDPGLVVTPEGLPRLFDEFYDPKHPASPQLAGTGLKLALVKTILIAHGGTAIAEKADIGTKLILTFSTKKSSPAAPGVIQNIKVTDSPVKPVVSASPDAKNPVSGTLSPIGTISPMGALPPSPAGTMTAPAASLPPIAGLTVGARPPLGNTPPAGPILPPLPPISGLTIGAKPPSAEPFVPPSPSSPSVPAAPVPPKPVPAGGILDALISGKIPSVTAPGLKPAGAPPSAPPVLPQAPRSLAPVPPPSIGVSGAPKPPLADSLDALLNLKPSSPSAPKPATPPANGDDLLE